MTDSTQPEALRLARALRNCDAIDFDHIFVPAAQVIEHQHARIAELESQLEAIGAGGVEPLRSRRCLHQIAEPAQAAPAARNAAERDALLQAAIDFIGTLTGMTPPPIEVAPPEVFAPFRAFVDRVQAITREYSLPAPVAQGDALTRALETALDAALDFAGTVAGGASWWGDVWANHEAAIDAARTQAKEGAIHE